MWKWKLISFHFQTLNSVPLLISQCPFKFQTQRQDDLIWFQRLKEWEILAWPPKPRSQKAKVSDRPVIRWPNPKQKYYLKLGNKARRSILFIRFTTIHPQLSIIIVGEKEEKFLFKSIFKNHFKLFYHHKNINLIKVFIKF